MLTFYGLNLALSVSKNFILMIMEKPKRKESETERIAVEFEYRHKSQINIHQYVGECDLVGKTVTHAFSLKVAVGLSLEKLKKIARTLIENKYLICDNCGTSYQPDYNSIKIYRNIDWGNF